jgi:hypothetical protein
MLRIGSRQYNLVRVQSGFRVELFPKDFLKRTQSWQLEAHYVPMDGSPPREDGELEHLELVIQSENYHLQNWRKLTGLELDNDEDTWFGSAWMENLLVGHFDHEHHDIIPGRLDVSPLNDYLFRCKFDGMLKNGDTAEDLEFEDDIPFAELSVSVPLNATDPVATASAIAAHSIGLTEIFGNRVVRHDWRLKKNPKAHVENVHRVFLQTPWHHHLA